MVLTYFLGAHGRYYTNSFKDVQTKHLSNGQVGIVGGEKKIPCFYHLAENHVAVFVILAARLPYSRRHHKFMFSIHKSGKICSNIVPFI